MRRGESEAYMRERKRGVEEWGGELMGFFFFAMQGNNIGDEGAAAVARSLKHNTSLTKLHLYVRQGERRGWHMRVGEAACQHA